jgi:hypothetical protein
MDLKLKAIYFTLLMMTASLAGCVSQDNYDTAVEEHEDEKAEDAVLIEGLQDNLSMSEANANALQAQLESLNATIGQSEADLIALQSQHAVAEASLAAAEANATNLGQMVTLLEDQLAMAYSAMDVLNTTMTDMQQYHNETMEEFTEQYNSTMANLSAQISAMSQSMSNLSATLNSTYAAYNSALSEISSLQSQVSSLNSTLAAKNEYIEDLELANNFVSSLADDFDYRFWTDLGSAIDTQTFEVKHQIYLTIHACWFLPSTCSDLWSLLEDDLPFNMNPSNDEKESIRYLSREMWNATTAAQSDNDLNDFALRLINEVESDYDTWNEGGYYTEDSTKCWRVTYVSGANEGCESVFLAWDSAYETDSQIFEEAEEGFLIGTHAYNTYDAYFCQSDVELTISRLLYTDVTIHIYNFGTTNETIIEPNSNTIGAVYGDNGAGVAYSFGSTSSLDIKNWDDPNGVCA